MLLVVGDQHAAEAKRVGGNHGVVAADGVSRPEQPGLKAGELVRGRFVPRQNPAQSVTERPDSLVVAFRVR